MGLANAFGMRGTPGGRPVQSISARTRPMTPEERAASEAKVGGSGWVPRSPPPKNARRQTGASKTGGTRAPDEPATIGWNTSPGKRSALQAAFRQQSAGFAKGAKTRAEREGKRIGRSVTKHGPRKGMVATSVMLNGVKHNVYADPKTGKRQVFRVGKTFDSVG